MSEEFAERLLAALHKKFPAEHGDAYITSTNLRLLILEALHPITVSQEFPRALYRGSSEFRTVENAQEEAKAIGEGWSRNAPAQFEPGYPRWFCERNTSEGGWKRFDLRRVQLNSPSEYEQWKAAVEESDWIKDNVVSIWGGRGIALADLVEERKQSLKAMIDAQALETSLSGGGGMVTEADADAGVSTPSSGVPSVDVSSVGVSSTESEK